MTVDTDLKQDIDRLAREGSDLQRHVAALLAGVIDRTADLDLPDVEVLATAFRHWTVRVQSLFLGDAELLALFESDDGLQSVEPRPYHHLESGARVPLDEIRLWLENRLARLQEIRAELP